MSEIMAVESVGGDYSYVDDQEETLRPALDRMALYLREVGINWYSLSGVYFVVRTLFETEKGKDWTASYEHLEQNMLTMSHKLLTYIADVQMIADDLEALARTNPTLNRTEIKRELVSCLRGILDQRPITWTEAVFLFENANRQTAIFGQLLAISYVLSEGNFSHALRSKGENLQIELRHQIRFGEAAPLGLLDDVYQLIDLLERD